MGQTLSNPDTKKKTESGGNDRLLYAASEMQGWRIGMEDAHATVLDLDDAPDSNAFFAVYDGHGGSRVSRYAGEHLHRRLAGEEAYQEKRYDVALKTAFLGTDEDLLATRSRDTSGATAVAALVTSDKIYVANAGDSRSVISVRGEVKPLSFDHKPTNDTEKARISAAGGYVDYGRVNGNLALSRALGDFEFKRNSALAPEQQIITADPEITCHDIDEEDEFLVLACDGIWDCLTSQQVVDVIRYEVSEGKELAEITELICDHCLAPDTTSRLGIGCDNMTILIVALLHNRTKEEWCSWVTDRVKNSIGYETPNSLPQLYSPNRIKSFRARQEAIEAHEKSLHQDDKSDPASLSGVARVLGKPGTISFVTSSPLFDLSMFAREDAREDSDEEDQKEEMPGSHDEEEHKEGMPDDDDEEKKPKDQIDEFEHDMEDSEPHPGELGDATSPRQLINGDLESSVAQVEQLPSQPGEDAPASVAKIEGFLDSSEDPLKI